MTAKKYFWITDPHFNFVTQSKLINYFLSIESKHPDGIFITGDISTGPHLVKHLQWLAKIVAVPIYFSLGNHDFYRASFESIEKSMITLMDVEPNLLYMTKRDPISLSENVAIIGHDGWYDAGWRDPLTPLIFIWDFFFIKDFRSLFSNSERMEVVRTRAKAAASSIAEKLRAALQKHSTVYLLTHFPPWPETIDKWGGLAENFWKPYNSCKVIADEISQIMIEYPSKKLIILAGHTHRERVEQISHNIELRVGKAKHNSCEIQDTIIIV